jgi:hypothetical protein
MLCRCCCCFLDNLIHRLTICRGVMSSTGAAVSSLSPIISSSAARSKSVVGRSTRSLFLRRSSLMSFLSGLSPGFRLKASGRIAFASERYVIRKLNWERNSDHRAYNLAFITSCRRKPSFAFLRELADTNASLCANPFSSYFYELNDIKALVARLKLRLISSQPSHSDLAIGRLVFMVCACAIQPETN